MSCPHETFILTFGSQKVDIYVHFFSTKNISKGKTSTLNSSILIVYGTKPPYYVITDVQVGLTNEQEVTCRRTYRTLQMNLTIWTDNIVGSDGPVHALYTLTGPEGRHREMIPISK